MSLFSHTRRQVPQLNTAALPDLIFTVLFFFISARYSHSKKQQPAADTAVTVSETD